MIVGVIGLLSSIGGRRRSVARQGRGGARPVQSSAKRPARATSMELPRGSSLAGRPSPLVGLRTPGSATRRKTGGRSLGGGPRFRGSRRPLFSGRRRGGAAVLARVAPIAGGAAVLVAVIVLVSTLVAPKPAKARGGSMGIGGTPLFGVPSLAFAAGLLAPEELAPADLTAPAVSGAENTESAAVTEALDTLTQATRAVEDAGYEVGYVLLDVRTGLTVSYNADAAFYSASSIKGPYVTGLVEYELGSSVASESKRINAILRYSDNDSYGSLRSAYGNGAFSRLVQASGAESLPSRGATATIEQEAAGQRSGGLADNWYEFLTPNQLLALWKQSYSFLTSGAAGADWLAEAFSAPETSAVRTVAEGIGTTWSKAGWYPGEQSAYATTVDAGVIRTSSGDVVVALMTNRPEDFAALESILTPLLSVRTSALLPPASA